MNFLAKMSLVVMTVTYLVGCSSQNNEWTRDDISLSDADQAQAECQYQADAATATIGKDDKPKTFGDAISDGIASGVVRGMEEADLVKACMKARGYSRQ